MRLALVTAIGLLAASGCAELGVVSDATSVSVGKASKGYLIDPARIPNSGVGFTTRAVWIDRGARYGTDEIVELITAVGRRLHDKYPDVRIVVGDLSTHSGAGGDAFHRSHQSGRDADVVYYFRDAKGKPVEPDTMHKFDKDGHARDGSGLTVDVPRTWALVKEIITAPEANVQWIFCYQPLANRLLEYAESIHEPDGIVQRARETLKQPGDSAPHDDHLHVRVYCTPADKAFGCVDFGPMERFQPVRPSLASQISPELAATLARVHWVDLGNGS